MEYEPNEQAHQSVTKFEAMLKTDAVYFFDAEDFEEIIHHYLNEGKISLAKKAIRMGLQQHPGALELKLLDVEVMVFENQFEKAESLLDHLQQIDPQNEEIFIQRANICSKQDNHLKAIELLQQAMSLADDDFDIHALLGMEYLFMDDYLKAKSCFMHCLDLDPEDYTSLYNLIFCFEYLEDTNGAITYLNNYLDSNPYSQIAWHQLGKQYYGIKMFEEALSAFDFAIISDDEFIGAYFEKGRVLEKLNRFQEAIDNYTHTMNLDNPTSQAYLRIGRCYEKMGFDNQAQHYYYLTVHEDPLLDKGWLAITDFYLSKKKFVKAKEYINKAINIDGENAIYWKRCAMIHKALGDMDEADFAFSQTVDLGDFALDTWLNWAEALKLNDEVESAAEILMQGKEFHPEAAELSYALAGIYHELGQETEACNHLKLALSLEPEKLNLFGSGHPDFYANPCVQQIISESRKASE
jgi:tetratricopeptide (TPR) repeat protein